MKKGYPGENVYIYIPGKILKVHRGTWPERFSHACCMPVYVGSVAMITENVENNIFSRFSVKIKKTQLVSHECRTTFVPNHV